MKSISITFATIVSAAIAAGAIADYQAIRLQTQAGVPVPPCADISLLRPPCLGR
jgi:hypothetical protein